MDAGRGSIASAGASHRAEDLFTRSARPPVGQFCKRWSLQLRGGIPRQKLFDSRYRMFGDAGTGAERAAQLFAAERLSHDMPRCQSVARHDVTEVARCKTT